MMKRLAKQFVALLCVAVLVFCNVGSVLAEDATDLPTTDTDQEAEETPALTLESPSISSIKNISEGVEISWGAVEGVTSYTIYRDDKSDTSEEFAELVTVEASTTTYVDASVKTGCFYTYKIMGSNESVNSELSAESQIIYLEAPIAQAEISDEGIYLTWNAIEGANSYRVVKYAEGAEEENVALVDPAWMDTDVKNGGVYRYQVCGIYYDEVNDSTTYGAYYEFEITYSIPETPANLKVTNNGYNELRLTWDAVTGADGYEVYRAESEDDLYERVAITEDLEYVDKELTTDQKYYYKVRAYKGETLGHFTEIQSGTPKVFVPKMKKTTNATSASIKISWEESAGATGYYVYRKQGSSGTWKQIATINGADTTSYKDTTATGRYYYAVRAYKEVEGQVFTSLRANSIQASVLKKASVTVKQKGSKCAVTVTWKKIANATGYQVYKKIGKNGSWQFVKTTGKDTTSYSCDIPQGKYTYWKVRAIRDIGETRTYALFSEYKTFSFATPKFNYELSTNYGKSVNTIKLTIENTSKGTLRFYTENAMVLNETNDSYDRDLYIAGSNGKKYNYSDVKAGQTKTISFKVDGSKTRYQADSIMCFKFRYDGLKYILLTYADGSYYELYLAEE